MVNQKRLLPLDDECMKDKKIDYKLFSLLQSLSLFNESTATRYVPKQAPEYGSLTREKLLELYNNSCAESSDCMSLRTMKTRITLFKGIGMIEEGHVKTKTGEEVSAFILLENYKTYQLIPFETLRFLANTVNSNVIKTYAFLLNRHTWKQKTGEYYSFTLKEVALAIGLISNYHGASKIIKDCLHLLSCIDLIHYVDYYTKTPDGFPSPRMRLTVANQEYKKAVK